MAEKVKYKYADQDLDMLDYIHNLNSNLNSYLEDRARHGGWSEGQVLEFRNSFDRYLGALNDQLTNNSGRLSTDIHGRIIDSLGELNDDDQDDFLYNDKGELIDRDQYNSLRKRKLKNYSGFQGNREFAAYAHKVAQALAKNSTTKASKETSDNAYDQNKHGWLYWWGNVQNADGGRNINPYLDLDKVDETTGKRARTNRMAEASKFANAYADWLEKQNLNYDGQALNGQDRVQRLRDLANKWGDGIWDANDLIAASQAGIDSNWVDGFFTEDEKPLSEEERAAKEAKAKADKEKADKEAEDKANREWFDTQYNNYLSNHQGYNEDNKFSLGQMKPYESDDAFRASFAEGTDFNKYISDWLKNPFAAAKDTRAIKIMKDSGYAKEQSDGTLYIPQDDDRQKGRALIYNPATGSLHYTFIGNVSSEWDDMRAKQHLERHPEDRYAAYMRKNGGLIEKMNIGGGFDFNSAMANGRTEDMKTKAQANGRTLKQEEAGERLINGDNASYQDQNAGFTSTELTRLGAIGGDIASMIVGFAGGNVASTAIGAGATTANLVADMNDDSVSGWDTFKNAAFGYGMDVVGAIPVFGATGKMAKMAKTATKLAPKVMLALGAYSGIKNAPAYYNSWKKLMDSDGKVSVDDWRNIAASIQLIAGGTAAVARQRAVSKAAKSPTDTVAMDFVDASGAKRTHIFEGADAKAIRQAKESGDIAQLENATIKKFDELKDLKLDVQGTRDGWTVPIWGKKVGAKEGTANVYDVKQGSNGEFIERGWATPDQMTAGVNRGGTTIADAQAARLAAEDAEIATQMAPLQSGSKRIEKILSQKDSKVNDLTTLKLTAELAVTAYDATKPAGQRSSSAILADIDRINANASGHAQRQTDYTKARTYADTMNNRWSTTNRQAMDSQLTQINRDLRTAKTDLATAQTALANAKSKKAKATAQKQVNDIQDNIAALTTRREKISRFMSDMDQRVSEANTKATTAETAMKDLDPSKLGGLSTELGAALGWESGRAPLANNVSRIQSLIDKWNSYTPNSRSAARQNLEARVDSDGNIEFTLASGDKVTRNWKDILTKLGIKYKQGGSILKLQSGRDVRGKLNWYNNMFKSDIDNFVSGQSFTDATAKQNFVNDFNARQKLWHDNQVAAVNNGWTPQGKVSYDKNVWNYQGNWQNLGLNKGISEYNKSNPNLHNTAKGYGDVDNKWLDGYFGSLEFIRHGGTKDSWLGKENELRDFQDRLGKMGLSYTLDQNTGMYNLGLLQNPETPVNNSQTTPAAPITSQTTPVDNFGTPEETGTGIENKTTPWKQTLGSLTMQYGVPRALGAIAHNRWQTANANKMAHIVDLKDPFEFNRYTMSDLDAELAGRDTAGQLNHNASHALTSDASLLTAAQYEAANKGLEAVNLGKETSNKASRVSNEAAWQQRKENAKNVHETAQYNNASENAAQRQILINNGLEKKQNHTILDTLGQQFEYDAKQQFNEDKDRNEQFVMADMEDALVRDPRRFTNLTDEELQMWNDYNSGAKSPSDYLKNEADRMTFNSLLNKISQARTKMREQYYGYQGSPWSNVRLRSVTPSWQVQIGKNGMTVKEKMDLQKLRNKSKDADRFHKNINKNKDRDEKEKDRISKYNVRHS